MRKTTVISSAALAAAAKQNAESRASVFIFIAVSLFPCLWLSEAIGHLYAKQVVQRRHLAFEFTRPEVLDDAAMLHHIEAVG